MKKFMRRARDSVSAAIVWGLPLLLGACAAAPRDASLAISDPNEEMNRRVMATNQVVLGPAAEVVKAAIPSPLHDRLHDLNSNLKEPRIFVNDVLQARFDAAARTCARFFLNSTFGLGGLFDIASREGLQQQSGDFGQTLFVWGVADGPYVVRPYLGPSTLRDAVGSTVDMVANPLGLVVSGVVVTASTTALDAADRLGQWKQAEDASVDFYSFIRSSYYQMRRAELREAVGQPNAIDSPALTDLDDPEPPVPKPVTTSSVAAARGM